MVRDVATDVERLHFGLGCDMHSRMRTIILCISECARRRYHGREDDRALQVCGACRYAFPVCAPHATYAYPNAAALVDMHSRIRAPCDSCTSEFVRAAQEAVSGMLARACPAAAAYVAPHLAGGWDRSGLATGARALRVGFVSKFFTTEHAHGLLLRVRPRAHGDMHSRMRCPLRLMGVSNAHVQHRASSLTSPAGTSARACADIWLSRVCTAFRLCVSECYRRHFNVTVFALVNAVDPVSPAIAAAARTVSVPLDTSAAREVRLFVYLFIYLFIVDRLMNLLIF